MLNHIGFFNFDISCRLCYAMFNMTLALIIGFYYSLYCILLHCFNSNAEQQPVRWGSDIDRYCDELEHYWIHSELRAVAQAVRLGIETQLPGACLSFMRWDELQELVCGNPKIDIALLCSATEYERGCSSTDPHIVWFWELMRSEFNEEDKRAFVRFVWGRTRLPLNRAAFTQAFKLQGFSVRSGGIADDYLPVSHTCFFSVELPRCVAYEIIYHVQ